MSQIPFNKPQISGRELDYIADAIARSQLSGDGYYTMASQRLIATATGAEAALLTHSCTAALELAALLLDLKAGDEVIMPSFTFVSTANAFALRGAIPVFVDIRADTLNLDETLIEEAITPRTRAICVVHYAGVVAEMDAINAIAERHGLVVIEDAAHAFGSTYHGRPAGSLGAMATLSFHETKNIISGEGGALLFRDARYVERAEIIREKGTNRKQFFRGMVDKYTWQDVGSSFLPGELIAAFLFGQLENAHAINAARLRCWQAYDTALRTHAMPGIGLPQVPQHCGHNAHLYYLILPNAKERHRFIDEMWVQRGIKSAFHYVALHSAPAGRRFGREGSTMIVTNRISEQLVRLPLFPGLEKDIERVTTTLVEQLQHQFGS